jgi:hypothetical protein
MTMHLLAESFGSRSVDGGAFSAVFEGQREIKKYTEIRMFHVLPLSGGDALGACSATSDADPDSRMIDHDE